MRSSTALCFSLVILLPLLHYGMTAAGRPLGEYKDWRSHDRLVNSTEWKWSTTWDSTNRDLFGVLKLAVNRYLNTELPIIVGTDVDEWVSKVTPPHMAEVTKHQRRIRKKSRKTSPLPWLRKLILQLFLVSLYVNYTRHTQAKRLYGSFTQFLHSVPVTTLPMSAGYSVLVKEMLLMVAGDVERNPGPTTLTVTDFREVLCAIHAARLKWWFIGMELGLSLDDLENIPAESQDNDKCLVKVLTVWLRQPRLNPSWESLAECMRSETVGREDIAVEIESKWCSPSESSILQQVFHNQSARSSTSPSDNALRDYISYLRSVYTAPHSQFPTYGKWPRTISISYVALASIKKEKLTENETEEIREATVRGDIDRVVEKRSPISMEEVLANEPNSGERPKCVLVEGGPGVGKTTFSWEVCRSWGKGELFQEYEITVFLQLRMVRVQSATKVTDLFCWDDEQQQRVVSHITRTHGKGVLLILDGLDELPEKLLSEDSIFGQLLSGTILPSATILVTSRPSVIGKLLATWENKVTRHVEILGFTKQSINDYTESVMSSNELPGFRRYLSAHPHIHTMMYNPLNSVIVIDVYKHSQQSNRPTPTTATQLYTDFSLTILQRYLRSHSDYKNDWNLSNFSDLPPPVLTCFQKLCEVAYSGTLPQQLQVIFKELGSSFDHLGFMHSSSDIFGPRGISTSYSFLHLSIQEYLAAVHMSQLPIQQQTQLCDEALTMNNNYKMDFHLPNVYKYFFGITQLKGFDLQPKHIGRLIDIHVTTTTTSYNTELQPTTIELLHETQIPEHINVLGESPQDMIELRLSLNPTNCTALVYCIAHSKCSWKLSIRTTDDDSDTAEQFASELGHYASSCAGRIQELSWRGYLSRISSHILQGVKSFSATLFNPRSIKNLVTTISSMDSLEALKLSVVTLPMDVFKAILNKLSTCSHVHTETYTISSTVEITTVFSLQYKCPEEKLEAMMPLECIVLLLESICNSSMKDKLQTIIVYVNTGILESESAKAFVALLEATKRLTTLCVQGSIGIGDAIAISEAVEDHETLRQVRIVSETLTLQSPGELSICMKAPPGDTVVLLQELCAKRYVKILNISRNELNLVMAEMSSTMLQNNWSLTVMAISRCSIGDREAEHLAAGLSRNQTLRELDVSWNSIGDKGAIALSHSLQRNSSLKCLDLTHNCIEYEGALAVAKSFAQNETRSRLSISLLPQCDHTVIITLAQSHSHYSLLLEVQNVILPEDVAQLTKVLCTNGLIKELALPKVAPNWLDLPSAQLFAETLKGTQGLAKVTIESDMGDSEAQLLANGLHYNTSVQELNIARFCPNIGDIGVTAIAQSLYHNQALQKLVLTANSSGCSGTIALAEAFSCSEVLQCLHMYTRVEYAEMSRTKLTTFSLNTDVLRQILEINPSIKELDASTVSLDSHPETAQAFAAFLARNQTLEQLSLRIYSPNYTDEAVDLLTEALSCNTRLREINLTSFRLPSCEREISTAAIAKLVHHNEVLRVLNVSGITFEPSGALPMAKSFNHSGTLQELTFDVGPDPYSALNIHLSKLQSSLAINTSQDSDERQTVTIAIDVLSTNPWVKKLSLLGSTYWCLPEEVVTLLKTNRLTHLDINGWKIAHQHLAEGLQHCTSLQQLNLSRSGSLNVTGRDHLLATAEALHNNASLQLLDLSLNEIEFNEATTLAEAFIHSKVLQRLTMNILVEYRDGNVGHQCNFGIELNRLPQLKLNIAITPVQLQRMAAPAQFLPCELLYLTRAVSLLSANEIKISTLCFTPQFVGALSTLLKESQILTRVTLMSCIHDTSHSKLDLAGHRCKLVSNQSLSEVRLKGRNIVGERILAQLLDGVNHSIALKVLDMSGIKFASESPQLQIRNWQLVDEIEVFSIGDAGAQLLAEGLKDNTTLEELNISRNDIGDTGALAIADLLTHNSTLRHLNLSFNSVEDRGATAIAESVGQNKALQELDLSENLIQDGGASSMAEVLRTNTTLQRLHMYTSKFSFCIGLRGTKALVDTLTLNQHLLRLTLPDKFHQYLQTLAAYHDHRHRIKHMYKTGEDKKVHVHN